MRIIAGPAARGDNFYDMEGTIERMWELLESDSHILIAAPRRVG